MVIALKPIALIVEDDPDQNIIFTAALTQAGYIVKSAYDGVEARAFLAEVLPTVVVLDLHLPRVTGDVILNEIRNDPRLKQVVVIVATSDASLISTLHLDAELVLLKPIGFTQLGQLVSRFVPKTDFTEA